MADGMVLAYYEKGGAGVVGLAPLTTVYQVALADLASVVIVNAQALTEIGGGLYARRVPNLDFALYWYPFKAVAAGADVDAEELAGLVHDFALVEMVDYGVAATGAAMTLETEERTTLAGVIWNRLVSALTVSGSVGRYLVECLAGIKAKTDLLGTGAIILVAPVLPSGDVDMVVGDVYRAEDGRAFDWTIEDGNIAVDSIVVVIVQGVAVFTAERLSAAAVRLELSSAQSATITPGPHTFYIREIQADGDPITLRTGSWVARVEPAPMPVPPPTP